jgi:hypothetical protein
MDMLPERKSSIDCPKRTEMLLTRFAIELNHRTKDPREGVFVQPKGAIQMASMVHELRDSRCEKAATGAMSHDEALTYFDASARRNLNMTGTEFLRRWDEGYFKGRSLDTRATKVAMLLPMVRPTVARKKSR